MSQTFDRFAPSEQPYQVQQVPAPKKSGCGCGCWLTGCCVLTLIILLGTGITGFFGYRFVKNQINQFTADAPVELPSVEYTEEELQSLNERMESFQTDVNVGQDIAEIEISADDINALINQSEDTKGRAFIRTDNDKLTCDVSIPLDGIPFAGGRYLNGSATLDVRMENGKLSVKLEELTTNGERIPAWVEDELKKQDLIDAIKEEKHQNEKHLAELLDRVEDFRIENGKIYLKLKPDMQSVGEDEPVEIGAE